MTPERCERSHPEEFALRATLPGDICILLEPTDRLELLSLQTRMAQLQTLYGGQPVSLVHLTCQRFHIPENHPNLQNGSAANVLTNLVEILGNHLAQVAPFPISALSLVPIHVPFEERNVLKWCISISNELRQLQSRLQDSLRLAQLPSLYRPWFIPTLISALKSIPDLNNVPADSSKALVFPQHLFTARQIQLSHIYSVDQYEILATLRL